MDFDDPKFQEVLRIAAKQHFWIFCNYMDREFFKRRSFLKETAIAINDIFTGKINRLSISMPPRSGKSYIMSLAAAYSLGIKPSESVMRNSATATLYMKFSYDTRDIVKSERFKKVFDCELADDKQAVSGWSLKSAKQVSYFGAGTGGTIIGFGASSLAITDDLYKGHEEALSNTINDKVHRWFTSAHQSRLEKECKEIDIGTRWTKTDVIGSRIEKGDYDKIITISALNENNESFCDDVRTTAQYLETKSITDPFIWNSEYMQQPIEAEGIVFDNLQYYETKNENRGYRIAFIDTADEGEDYLSMPVIEYYKETNQGYLIDVLFNQYNLTTNEALIIQKANELQLDYIIVETNKEGTYFVNTLRKVLKIPVYGKFNSTNKITRILAQSGFIMKYFKFKKNHSAEYDRFMYNLSTFLKTGRTKHDDAPDSLAGLTLFLRQKMGL